jgi:hypothetical protein
MRDIPEGVLLLYSNSLCAYTARSYSTTAREFVANPLLHPKLRVFTPLAPLLNEPFQVDKTP